MSIARPDESRAKLLFRNPMYPLALGSELMVAAEECAVLHSNGRILGAIGPGQHRLVPQAFPFLGSAIMNGAIDAELWFVTTAPWRGVQFGGSIGELYDAASKIDFEARVFGACTIVASDPVRLLQACMGQSLEGDAIGPWVGSVVIRMVKDAAAALVMEGTSPLKLTGPVLEEHLRGASPELEMAGLRFVQLGNLTFNFSEDSVAAYKQWSAERAAEKRQQMVVQQAQQAQPQHAAFPPGGAAGAPVAGVLAVGARVLVQWSDGNRYPGVVQQLVPGQVLVAFPNGQAQWVPAPFVAPV